MSRLRSILSAIASPRRLGWTLFGVALLWIGGMLYFVDLVERPVRPPTRAADGIVVLTGSSERVKPGIRLLSEGRGQRLLISGVGEGVDKAALSLAFNVDPGLLDCCVDLGAAALDTVGNASETAAWVRRHGYKSVLVVTANYHMPRGLIELTRQMPDVELIANPVRLNGPTLGNLSYSRKVFAEYNKFLISAIRARLEALTAPGGGA